MDHDDDINRHRKLSNVEWWINEIIHWRQRCEELELELTLMQNAFPEHDNDVKPKQRGIF